MEGKVTAPEQKELEVIWWFYSESSCWHFYYQTLCCCFGGLGRKSSNTHNLCCPLYYFSFPQRPLFFYYPATFATWTVPISGTNLLKIKKEVPWSDRIVGVFLRIVMTTSLYTGHLSHSETSTIWSHTLFFVPSVDQKSKEPRPITIIICCSKEWQLNYH